MKRAINILNGAAIKIAKNEVTNVPKINPNPPNSLNTGFHSALVMKFNPNDLIAGHADIVSAVIMPTNNKITIIATVLKKNMRIES